MARELEESIKEDRPDIQTRIDKYEIAIEDQCAEDFGKLYSEIVNRYLNAVFLDGNETYYTEPNNGLHPSEFDFAKLFEKKTEEEQLAFLYFTYAIIGNGLPECHIEPGHPILKNKHFRFFSNEINTRDFHPDLFEFIRHYLHAINWSQANLTRLIYVFIEYVDMTTGTGYFAKAVRYHVQRLRLSGTPIEASLETALQDWLSLKPLVQEAMENEYYTHEFRLLWIRYGDELITKNISKEAQELKEKFLASIQHFYSTDKQAREIYHNKYLEYGSIGELYFSGSFYIEIIDQFLDDQEINDKEALITALLSHHDYPLYHQYMRITPEGKNKEFIEKHHYKPVQNTYRKMMLYCHELAFVLLTNLEQISESLMLKCVNAFFENKQILRPTTKDDLYAWLIAHQNEYGINDKLIQAIEIGFETHRLAQLKKPMILKNIFIDGGEAWSDLALERILKSGKVESWEKISQAFETLSSTKPNNKWIKKTQPLVDELGHEHFIEEVCLWLAELGKPGSYGETPTHSYGDGPPNYTLIQPYNAVVLKGLVWACSFVKPTPELYASLSDWTTKCFQKIPQQGMRAEKVGNACLNVLASYDSLEAVAALGKIKAKARYNKTIKVIDKILYQAAEKAGISVDELEEMATPAFGLSEASTIVEQMGDYTATLSLASFKKTKITFVNDKGKTLKSVPAAVKESFKEELKDLKASAKDIEKMLPAVRYRLENLYLAKREIPYEKWLEYYLHHPLVAGLTKLLIWRFTHEGKSKHAIWDEGKMITRDGQELKVADDVTVSLWHPIHSEQDEIEAWRTWMLDHEICQPFKQAYRELYLITDAELNTNTYSNRFAAHIINQHTFYPLTQVRRWKYQRLTYFDDGCDEQRAMKSVDAYQVRAEFWIDTIGESTYDEDNASDTGMLNLVSTDQVRFYPITERLDNEPMPMADVPPMVFSEIMRDVDLYVAVCSVGNDPTWQDGRVEGHQGEYWQSYSFGELGNTAQTRKVLLKKLIPRLKIADRCSIEDRFLVVRGELRTYKIHLGSGNILMTPNDQYLCIVPDRKMNQGDKVFLPFDGDRTLSIILSKAFLLADDKKIKDSTITSQIKQGS